MAVDPLPVLLEGMQGKHARNHAFAAESSSEGRDKVLKPKDCK
jgi:hypothetical protein